MTPEFQLLERVPLWSVYVASVVIVMLSIRAGLLIAAVSRKRRPPEEDEPLGSVVGATLGLLAFMLAFTFGFAVARRDAKKELLIEDVTSIRTTYLRSDLIPEPHRSEVRKDLMRYVDLRVEVARDAVELREHPEQLRHALDEMKAIHRRLWAHAAALRDAELANPDIAALFIDSLNETIDLQTKRIAVLYYRIPGIIWVVLGALTVLSMAAVGYQFGQKGRYNWAVNLALALSFSVVIMLIADLDSVTSNWLRISNQPMVELQQDMKGP
jgi:hypothetical protein